MGLRELRVVPTCCAGFCCFWFIFTCVALPLSFKSLDQGMYALQLGWASQQIADEVVVEPGLQFVGLGNMLIEYPSVYLSMYFSHGITPSCASDADAADATCTEVIRPPIYARTADGLEMKVSVSFQFRLQPHALKPLYTILGSDLYKDEFVRFARAAVIEGCSHFAADAYFTNRTMIKIELLSRLVENFNQPERGLEVEVSDVQLREVDLPDDFDDEIANTQEQMQEVEVALAEREEQRIAMDRELQVAGQKVDQIVTEARGEAEKIRLNNVAYVEQLLAKERKEATANAAILQMFDADEDPFMRLFEVMKVKAISDHADTKLLINL